MRLAPTLLAVTLLASCASGPGLLADGQPEAAKQCSDTPRGAVSTLLQGIKEFSIGFIRMVTLDGVSLLGIFGNNDEIRGQQVVREIVANPEVAGEGGSCVCSLLSMEDTADPDEKTVVVKRIAMVGDDLRDYKRKFRVRFASRGNCILTIDPVDQKWERM